MNKLEGQGIPYQLGLVSYEYSSTKYDLTSDVNTFIQNVNTVYADGDTENGLDAIMTADSYEFELNSAKYFILIGDENVYSVNGHSDASVIQTLKEKHIILTTVGIDSIRYQFTALAQSTGGKYLDLNSDFDITLDQIFQQINSIPVIESVTPKPDELLSDKNVFYPSATVKDVNGDTLTVQYFINGESEPREKKEVSNTKSAQVVTFSKLAMAQLPEGEHKITYSVTDGTATVKEEATFRLDTSPPEFGEIEVTASETSISISGSATDSYGLDPNPYSFEIGNYQSGWTTSSSYKAENLVPNTSYSVLFQARDSVQHIREFSKDVVTKAQLPSIQVDKASEEEIALSISDSNPVNTEYQILVNENQYVASSGNLVTDPQWRSVSNKTVTVHGLEAGKKYGIQVKARNSEQVETVYSSVVPAWTHVYPPKALDSESSQQWINVTWSGSPEAARYDVEADGVIYNAGKAEEFKHTGLQPNTRHEYKVRAVTLGGAGQWSAVLAAHTLPDPPAVPANIGAEPSQTEVALEWDASAKAERYEIEADSGTVYTELKPSFTHRDLKPKEEHTYRIRAINSGGTSDWSKAVTVKTLPYPPVAPAQPLAQPSIYAIEVSWNKVEEADGYEVEVDGFIVDTGDTDTYVHDELEPVSGHTYRVRAKNAGGKSAWSDRVDMTTHPEKPSVPSNIMSTSDETSVTLTWYKVIHTDSYEVEVDGRVLKNIRDNQYIHDDLRADTMHTYRLRAVNISGKSDWSRPVSMRTMPPGNGDSLSLTNIVALVTNNRILISWDTVSADAKYDVEVDGTVYDNGLVTLYNHTGLSEHEFHTYKIRLQTKDGTGGGEWVAALSLSTLPNPPDAPGGVQAFAKEHAIELRWDKVGGATGYDIEIDGKVMDLGTARDYLHNELGSGTSHTYRIRAKNETGVTAWSASITKSTTSPDYVVQAAAGQPFEVSLLGWNVQDFSELSFVVNYNPEEVEVYDLYAFTPNRELMSGVIPGSPLNIDYKRGRIVYQITRSIVPGTSWSGEVAAAIFKARKDGEITLRVTIE